MLRDWLVAKIRVWLGIECDSTALFARLEKLEQLQKENNLLQDTVRANVSKIASLEGQLAKLRDIQTAKPPKAPIQQMRSWSETLRHIGADLLEY